MAEQSGSCAVSSHGFGTARQEPKDWSYSARARWIKAGDGGPGGWSCHTFEDGQTFPLICLADDCPLLADSEDGNQ